MAPYFFWFYPHLIGSNIMLYFNLYWSYKNGVKNFKDKALKKSHCSKTADNIRIGRGIRIAVKFMFRLQ